MNLLDIILLLPLAYGLYAGYNKGLIRQLTGLIGIILAFLFSFKLSHWVSNYLLTQNIVEEDWSNLMGFILTFIGILIVVKLVGNLVRKTSKSLGLGFFEQILGGIFGVLKSFLIVMVLLYLFLKINAVLEILSEEVIATSQVYPYYRVGFDYMSMFWETQPN